MKPVSILKLEEELGIEINLSTVNDFFDLANRNTYKINEQGEIFSLNLFENKITNIFFIKEFQALKELDLRDNPIRDFTPLENFNQLILFGYGMHKINSQSYIYNFLKNEIYDMSRHSSKIAAVYIHNHEFLFDKPQIINLGGRNNYCIESYDDKSVALRCKPNLNFIESFFGEDIALVTAIVGENGTGKTSLITKLFNQLIPVRTGEEKCVFFIIEETETIKFYSFFDIENDFKITSKNFDAEIEKGPFYGFPIYFSNYLSDNRLHKEQANSLDLSLMNQILKDINSDELRLLNSDFSFSVYKNTQLKRWMKLLSNKEVVSVLDDYSLPNFNNINIEFYEKRMIGGSRFDLFRFNVVDYKHRKTMENEVKNAVLIFDDIYRFLKIKMSEKAENPITHQAVNGLILKLIAYVIELISNQNKKNVFPKIKNIEGFKNLNDIKDPVEIFKLLEDNFYFVDINNNKSNIVFPFELFNVFFKTLAELKKNNENILIEHGSKIGLDFESAIKILDLYEKVYLRLDELLELDNHQFLRFSPNIIISSGEEMILNLISLLYVNKEKDTNVNLPKILFLDEADLGLHPKWKKMFINTLIKVLPKIFIGMRMQIIFTTHDPLTLSDIPNANIVYLKKENDKTLVLDDDNKPKKSFGANITDLLGDSFFIDNGLVGDFSKQKINEVIDWLITENRNLENKEYNRKIIDIIDEPLVKYKLKEMYFENFPEEFDKEDQLKKLNEMADKLGYVIKEK